MIKFLGAIVTVLKHCFKKGDVIYEDGSIKIGGNGKGNWYQPLTTIPDLCFGAKEKAPMRSGST